MVNGAYPADRAGAHGVRVGHAPYIFPALLGLAPPPRSVVFPHIGKGFLVLDFPAFQLIAVFFLMVIGALKNGFAVFANFRVFHRPPIERVPLWHWPIRMSRPQKKKHRIGCFCLANWLYLCLQTYCTPFCGSPAELDGRGRVILANHYAHARCR